MIFLELLGIIASVCLCILGMLGPFIVVISLAILISRHN